MKPTYGTLEVLAGPMYAGKSSEVLKRILWARTGQSLSVRVFKPAFDNRYAETEIVSHDGLRSPAESIDAWPTLVHLPNLIVIDEIQFFTEPYFHGDMVEIVRDLLGKGVHVIAAGLDMDWQGKPFHVTSMLLGMADTVVKLKANCTVSGRPAGKTFKKSASGGSVELGAADKYEARSNEYWRYE